VSDHSRWAEVRRGPPGSWNRVAGDDRQVHYFIDTTRPQFAAVWGAGPAVGMSNGDTRLAICTICLPIESGDVEGLHCVRTRANGAHVA